jgi:hypothetical protein
MHTPSIPVGQPRKAVVNNAASSAALPTQRNTQVAVLFFVRSTARVDCKFVLTSGQTFVSAANVEPSNPVKKTYAKRTQEQKDSILALVDYIQLKDGVGVAKAVATVNKILGLLEKLDEKTIRDWRAAKTRRAEREADDDGLPQPQRGRPSVVPENVRQSIKKMVRVVHFRSFGCYRVVDTRLQSAAADHDRQHVEVVVNANY